MKFDIVTQWMIVLKSFVELALTSGMYGRKPFFAGLALALNKDQLDKAYLYADYYRTDGYDAEIETDMTHSAQRF